MIRGRGWPTRKGRKPFLVRCIEDWLIAKPAFPAPYLWLVFVTNNTSSSLVRTPTESTRDFVVLTTNHELWTINWTEEVINMTKKLILGFFLVTFLLLTTLVIAGEKPSNGPVAIPSKCDCLNQGKASTSTDLKADVINHEPLRVPLQPCALWVPGWVWDGQRWYWGRICILRFEDLLQWQP